MPDGINGYWVVVCDIYNSPLPIRDRSLAYVYLHKGYRVKIIVRDGNGRTRWIMPWVSIRCLHNFKTLFIGPSHEEYEWKYDARWEYEAHAISAVHSLEFARNEWMEKYAKMLECTKK